MLTDDHTSFKLAQGLFLHFSCESCLVLIMGGMGRIKLVYIQLICNSGLLIRGCAAVRKLRHEKDELALVESVATVKIYSQSTPLQSAAAMVAAYPHVMSITDLFATNAIPWPRPAISF